MVLVCVATEREAQSLKRGIKLDRFSFEHIDPVNENMKSGKYNHKEKLLRVERVGKLSTSINLYKSLHGWKHSGCEKALLKATKPKRRCEQFRDRTEQQMIWQDTKYKKLPCFNAFETKFLGCA